MLIRSLVLMRDRIIKQNLKKKTICSLNISLLSPETVKMLAIFLFLKARTNKFHIFRKMYVNWLLISGTWLPYYKLQSS
jgi:hypothetical protein